MTSKNRRYNMPDGWHEWEEDVWLLYRKHIIRAFVDCHPINPRVYGGKQAIVTVFTDQPTATITTQVIMRRCNLAKRYAERLVNQQDKQREELNRART